MKRCPECRRDYYDDTLLYCLDDGNALLEGPASGSGASDEPATAILHVTDVPGEAATRAQINTTNETAILPASTGDIVPTPRGLDKRLLAAPFLLAIIALGGFFGYRYFSPAKQIESIAVMPFVNESKNEDFEYLSDGMTETLISSLSKLPNLNVKPRSSVFRYKGKDTDPQTIAKELNVQAILNGKVVQRGQDVSLFVELIDVALDKVVWSQQYTRKQSDLVTLQSDIARDVSGKLKSKLSSADVAKVERNSNVNAEAYQLYLKGLFQYNRRTTESLKQAEQSFKQAIEKDPNYAPAYVGLGRTLLNFPFWMIASPADSYPQAKASALKALELDDSLAGAHSILGYYLHEFDFDHTGAEREFRRAMEMEPNNPDSYDSFAHFLANLKRFDEAIAAGRRNVELDPLSKRHGLIDGYYAARRFDEAIAELKAVIGLDPNFAEAYYSLGVAYYGKGAYKEAAENWQKFLELDDDTVTRAYFALAKAKTGNRDEAVKLLDWFKQESAKRYIAGYAFAITYLALGEKEKALEWLEKDVDDRSSWGSGYSVMNVLDDVRDEPRFKALLKRMNLPE